MNVLCFRHWRVMGMAFAVFASVSIAATAQLSVAPRYASDDRTHPDRVDIALVLAVDVSSSIESSERRFQREAYAQALRDPRVAQMALGGSTRRIAIAYMEWSGKRYQRVHVPMRVMTSAAELAAFAQEIEDIEDATSDPMFVQPTAVGDALLAAESIMSQLRVPAREYIIDISGDGVLNDGLGIQDAREYVLSMGLTVNGLPIEVAGNPASYQSLEADHVARFYMDCVIGGPGAFHLVARGFSDVRETLIMKLMLEMARLPAQQKTVLQRRGTVGHLGMSRALSPRWFSNWHRPKTRNDISPTVITGNAVQSPTTAISPKFKY